MEQYKRDSQKRVDCVRETHAVSANVEGEAKPKTQQDVRLERDKRIDAILDEGEKKYGEMLKRLAE